MVRAKTLHEELLRMPPKTKHFTVTRFEFLHVRMSARARMHSRLSRVYALSSPFNVRLTTHVGARLRFSLLLALLLLRRMHLLSFCRRSRLCLVCLSLRRLLLVRCLA